MNQDRRPDPEELLARARREEARAADSDGALSGRPRRGRLKIFFGMAPGVGKTYAMLTSAQRLAAQGIDVVVGVVETHGRRETEQLTLGLDVLPRSVVEYRGADGLGEAVRLEEFDLDAALRRAPAVLLIDELAHTNAPGSTHEKRWQDVRACLAAGIDVHTTLNVQHIESLHDIVAQVTGVQVAETVPDSVLDEADEVELVDLPSEALLERLRVGKVYVPEAARRALDSFFRPGNLAALRQLALRRTAEWVDRRMREYKEDQAIRAVWPAADRVLVAVSPSPLSPKVVRAAARMALERRAELLAAYVEGPGADRLSQRDRERVLETLRLAERLGAHTETVSCVAGEDPAETLVELARSRDASRIVIGKTRRSRLAELLVGSFSGRVIRASGAIDVQVISGDSDEGDPVDHPADRGRAPKRGRSPWRWLGALAPMAAASAVALSLFRGPDLSDEAMLLLGGIILSALWFGRGAAVLAAALAVLGLNFLFTEPRYTLYVDDPRALLTFGVMIAVGLLVGTMAARNRDAVLRTRDNERRTAALYAMARELSAAATMAEVASAAARDVAVALDADTVIGVPAPTAVAGIDVVGSSGAPDWIDAGEGSQRSVARWALDHGRAAGMGTSVFGGAPARFVPLVGAQGRVGVLGVRPRSEAAAGRLLETDRLLLLEALASQTAGAMERLGLIESREAARVEMEAERLRAALLASVSHDLRTPLATIEGAASTLRDGLDRLPAATREELLDSVVSESHRLNELIANLVFATRLESGALELRRDWTTVEELVGAGIHRHRARLASRPFRVAGLAELPMVRVDETLIPMVIDNLVENALRYTPDGTPIAISAWVEEGTLTLRVADEGPGLAEGESAKVFQRFYRGRTARLAEGAVARGGMGLGLTICDGIVRAHGGRIWAEGNLPRGVAFLIALPLEPAPPIPAAESSAPATEARS